MSNNNYIINGREEGKKRLNLLSDVMYPHTRALLEAQGLVTESIITQKLNELEDFTRNEQTIISLPRIFRVWGGR